MKIRSLALTLSALALAAASFAANADIVFTNLGTDAPPASVGSHGLVPFDQGPQAAISDFTNVTAIPGGPNGTSVGLSVASSKRTVGGSWGTWSHGYTGAVYYPNGATTVTLNLPAGTEAFYVYAEPDPFSYQNITATSNTGAGMPARVRAWATARARCCDRVMLASDAPVASASPNTRTLATRH